MRSGQSPYGVVAQAGSLLRPIIWPVLLWGALAALAPCGPVASLVEPAQGAEIYLADRPAAPAKLGVVVTEVLPGGAAGRAGVQVGDQVRWGGDASVSPIQAVFVLEHWSALTQSRRYRLDRGERHLTVELSMGEASWSIGPAWPDDLRAAWDGTVDAARATGAFHAALELAERDEVAADLDALLFEWWRTGEALISRGHFEAVQRFCVPFRERARGGWWEVLPVRLDALASAASGQHDRARMLFAEAVELASVDATQRADLLYDWSQTEMALADTARAMELARESLSLRRQVAPASLFVAQGYELIALIQWWAGNVIGYRLQSEAGLAIAREAAPRSITRARLLSMVAVAEWAYGQVGDSNRHQQQAVALVRELAPGSRHHADMLLGWAQPMVLAGKLVEARDAARLATEIYADQLAGSLSHSWGLSNVGQFELWLGNYRESRRHLLAAWEMRRAALPGTPMEAYALMNLAELATHQGDLRGARQHGQRALEILQLHHPGTAAESFSLRTLGEAELFGNAPKAAHALFSRALQIQTAFTQANGEIIRLHLDMGQALLKLGDLSAAQRHFESAEQMHDTAAGIGVMETLAISLHWQAQVAERLGDPDRARSLDERALQVYEHWDGNLMRALILHHMGRLAEARGESVEALARFEEAVQEMRDDRWRVGGQWARVYAAGKTADMHHSLIGALLRAGRDADALIALEESRARAANEVLAAGPQRWEQELSPGLRERLDDLRERRQRLSARALQAGPPASDGERSAIRAGLIGLRQEEDLLIDRVRAENPHLAAARYPRPVSLERLAAAIPEGVIFVAFSVGVESTHVFAVQRAEEAPAGVAVRGREVPIGRESLRQRVRILRGLLTREHAGRRSEAWRSVSAGLSEQLLEGLGLEQAAGRPIVFLPNGPLQLFPVALWLDRTQRPLIESRALSVAPSFGTFRRMRTREPIDGGLTWIGIGAPAEAPPPTASARGRHPLPGARAELEAIHGLIGTARSRLYTGERASESTVRALDEGATIVHFASHGIVDEELPMQSALVLTPGPEPHADDGYLQAWEILDAVTLPAELVVLSGCETGLGEIVDGEGFLGLSRAFLFRGAKSVLASMWPISDQSTTTFMDHLYRGMWSGLSKSEALRQAQLAMLSSRATDHPYHWAAFQLVGDDQALQPVALQPVGSARRAPLQWIAAAALLIVGLGWLVYGRKRLFG